jgi:hypothetical protein
MMMVLKGWAYAYPGLSTDDREDEYVGRTTNELYLDAMSVAVATELILERFDLIIRTLQRRFAASQFCHVPLRTNDFNKLPACAEYRMV